MPGGHCHYSVYRIACCPGITRPGVLLHQEAGGYAARFDGSAYTPTEVEGGLICTPDQASWRALRTGLLEE